jgi:nitrogen fixation protein FixH
MTRNFTGFHITAILVAFFGIVIAVNLVMARAATSTFGGALAENGYVASQDYNRWIAESAAQDRLGWTLSSDVVDGHLMLTVEGVAAPTVTAIAEHPLGRVDEQVVALTRQPDGRFRSDQRLMEGRWKLRVTVRDSRNEARFLRDVRR